MGYFKGIKEFELGDVRNVRLDEIFEFATVHALKGTKAPNVERLSKMRGVRRKANSDNAVLLAVTYFICARAIQPRGPLPPQILLPNYHTQ